MNARQLCTALIVTLVFAASAFSESRASKGTTNGTFAGIEQGDYAHLLVKTASGKQESYFVLQVDKSVQPYVEYAAKMRGRKVRVYWEERNENIPEAGGKQKIKLVTKVEERR